MTAEAIAKALGGRKASGGWTARCPAHDDRTPSLSIRDAANHGLYRSSVSVTRMGSFPNRRVSDSRWRAREVRHANSTSG